MWRAAISSITTGVLDHELSLRFVGCAASYEQFLTGTLQIHARAEYMGSQLLGEQSIVMFNLPLVALDRIRGGSSFTPAFYSLSRTTSFRNGLTQHRRILVQGKDQLSLLLGRRAW